ncbi:hypothetical protein C7399_109169 [Paraburkholderia tropica]|uniref:Uncharacterized protein n=2 Tax=Paraburkholderia tropica TaxID=92647 RepID=A0ABX5MNM1_9BURK|nr:hypothetical protein C7400_109169 [Paraburkholderia tropica]PZW82093.1 hypothetical protein C7399_109169 [Paraburkholderia tropica]
MKIFSTNDVASSIRRAHQSFTHILVNRGYTTIKPVFFRSSLIGDLPVYQWAWWNKATYGQLDRWRANGGVLLDQYTFSDRAGLADVLVFVECPMTMERIVRSGQHVAEYSVLPRPHTWSVHEQCIDLRTPSVDRLKDLWSVCGGKRMTDDELADAVDIPKQHVQYMRSSLKPVEKWEIKPRLRPESAALIPAWEWIGAGRSADKKEVRMCGHKAAVKEMARLGHIRLQKIQSYPEIEPDWGRLDKCRAKAITDLASVRSLVESLPDHLQA